MAVAVTNTNVATYNTITSVTANAATSSVINETEVFTITPTRADNKVAIVITNGPTHGTLTYSIAAGGAWAAGSALTGSVAQSTTRTILLEGGKYKSASGTYVVTFTPASGKRLLTDHALSVEVIELPF
jgi:hypothetical protein